MNNTTYFDKGYDAPVEKNLGEGNVSSKGFEEIFRSPSLVYQQALEKYKNLEIIEDVDDEIRKFIIEEKETCVDQFVTKYGFSDSDLWQEYIDNNQPCVSTSWYKNEVVHNSRLDKNGNRLPARILWNGVIEFVIDGKLDNEDIDENGILMPAVIFPNGTVARCIKGIFVQNFNNKSFSPISSPTFTKFIQNDTFHSINEKKELCPAEFIKFDNKIYNVYMHEEKRMSVYHSFYKNGEYIPSSYMKCKKTGKIHPLYMDMGKYHSYRDVNSKMLPARHVCYDTKICVDEWYKKGELCSWNPLGNSHVWMPAIEAPDINLKVWIVPTAQPMVSGNNASNYYILYPVVEMNGWKCYINRIVSPTNITYMLDLHTETTKILTSQKEYFEHIQYFIQKIGYVKNKIQKEFPSGSIIIEHSSLYQHNCPETTFFVSVNNVTDFYVRNVKLIKKYFNLAPNNIAYLRKKIKGDILYVYAHDTDSDNRKVSTYLEYCKWQSYSLVTGMPANVKINNKIYASGFQYKNVPSFFFVAKNETEREYARKKYKILSIDDIESPLGNYQIYLCNIDFGIINSNEEDMWKFIDTVIIK